ncbi:MAG: hypothetical protein KAX20_05150 [Candidatus Omnitrophica bacterium]|nr:hypothetical protein [Candidatus Omnitrophota bacterium]
MNKNNEGKQIEDLLRKKIEEGKKLRENLYRDFTSMLKENIIQRRDWVKNLVIVSGAIASFSMLGLNSPLIKGETFFTAALIMLLIIIGYSVYLLNKVLRRENVELTKEYKEYNEDNDEIMQSDKRTLQEKMSKESIEDRDKTQNEIREKYEAKTQKSKNSKLEVEMSILVEVFLISLLFIGFSFTPIENKIFTWILKVIK